MSELTPFRVDVPDTVLGDLRDRLVRTRWPDQIPESGWGYGTDRAYLQQLCEHWVEKFDWRSVETALNSHPQYTTVLEVDGAQQRVHFLHVTSPHQGARPLLITHGWPGSVLEFSKIIGPLVNPPAYGGDAADAFHLVIPSMPGYGWSG